jgi:hypothetical protein
LVSPVGRGRDFVAIDSPRLVFSATNENRLFGSLTGAAAIVGPRDNHLPLADGVIEWRCHELYHLRFQIA